MLWLSMRKPIWILAIVLVAGCAPNESGHVAATSSGQLLSPQAPRVDPTAELRASCGEAGLPSSDFARLPYLQSVSSTAATLVWTTTTDVAAVEVWSADSPRRRVDAADEATQFMTGARQENAHMSELTPGTIHCYELLSAAGDVVFGPYGFRTAPEPGGAERIDFIVFGDSGGGGPDQLAVSSQLTTVPIHFVLHTGDVAYMNGTLEQFETTYFGMYESWLQSFPVFLASGNHDYETADAGPFREVFALPENAGSEGRERWYSFDWGPVHVAVLDTEVSSAAQAAFLEADLASTDRPWRIVVAHKGPYTSGYHGPNATFRELYEPLLVRYGVQIAFTGHDHHYERSHPIDGVTYIVTGGGGMSTRPVSPTATTAFAEDVLHFVYASIEGDRLRVHAIDGEGKEFDGAEIMR